MSVFDVLVFVDDLLGVRVQGCTRIKVDGRFPPGPCPKGGGKKAWNRRRRLKSQGKAVAKGTGTTGAGAYTGPSFQLPAVLRPKWDAAISRAARASAPGASQDERDAARDAANEFRRELTEPQLRRFDQEAEIDEVQAQWQAKSVEEERDTPEQMRAKMAGALRDLWGGKKIAVRVTAEGLENVLRTGRFKTVHETYKTQGFNNGRVRGEVEEQIFGIDPDGGEKEKRPVYGYVAVNGIRRPGADSALGQYGSVQVVLKDEVRKRTTASNGDSIGKRRTVRPSPVDAPQHWSYNVTGQPAGQYGVDGEVLMNRGYAEAQVHGGVSVDDIEEVVFPRVPEDRVQRRLNDAGVAWRIVE